MCRAEWWILWRRIAGGLAAGQQQALADPVLGPIRAMHRQLTTGKGRGGELNAGSHETAEIWRLLGSLELLPCPVKIELGRMLIDLIPRRKMEMVRVRRTLDPGTARRTGAALRAAQHGRPRRRRRTLAPGTDRTRARRPDDRFRRDAIGPPHRRPLPRHRPALRDKAVARLERRGAAAHYIELVRHGGQLDDEEQAEVFGEALPIGLRLPDSG